jgi:hypothetical protein
LAQAYLKGRASARVTAACLDQKTVESSAEGCFRSQPVAAETIMACRFLTLSSCLTLAPILSVAPELLAGKLAGTGVFEAGAVTGGAVPVPIFQQHEVRANREIRGQIRRHMPSCF